MRLRRGVPRVLGERRALGAPMLGERRASGHEADAAGNQGDAHPAQRTDLLVQCEAGNQGEQNVSQRGCGQHVGQIGPGQRVGIRSEKGEQQDNPARNPGIPQGHNDTLQLVERNAASLLHALRKHGVARGREDAYSRQNQILSESQSFKVSGSGAVCFPMASSRAEPFFRRRKGSRANTVTMLARSRRPREKTRAYGMTPSLKIHHYKVSGFKSPGFKVSRLSGFHLETFETAKL